MATPILSENSEPVLLSCHQGLSAEEITYDCLEKAKALTQVGVSCQLGMSLELPAAYLSAIDDWLELGLNHCQRIGLSPRRCPALVRQKHPMDSL
jgi:hypothetical protein